MPLSANELKSLTSLPCFEGSVVIARLTSGMSHTCVKVTSPSQVFFAKKLNLATSKAEVLCTKAIAQANSTNQLVPAVIYHDEEWLVTEFIEGKTLANSDVSSNKRLTTGLTLMVRLHELSPLDDIKALPVLDTANTVALLLSNSTNYLAGKLDIVTRVSLSLSLKISMAIEQTSPAYLLCHGDINYTNILLDKDDAAWLIDFECAHLAPKEFDIAMFIAVNNIAIDNIAAVIKHYECLLPKLKLNTSLLSYYLLYSYFINGLWYLDNINESQIEAQFLSLVKEQWQAFDNYATNQQIDMPRLSTLLSK